MLTPSVTERQAQPYVAIRAEVTMANLADVLVPLHSQVFAWLGERGVPPAGPPFWKYNVIDMDTVLEVEVGVPVAAPLDGGGRVLASVLPAGQYAAVRYTGHPSGIIGAVRFLLDWAHQEGLTWDMTDTPAGERWGCRLEIYETGPAGEPDMAKRTTLLAFRLVD